MRREVRPAQPKPKPDGRGRRHSAPATGAAQANATTRARDTAVSRFLSEDELRLRAERLIAEGRMPSFADVLSVLQDVLKNTGAAPAQTSASSRTSGDGVSTLLSPPRREGTRPPRRCPRGSASGPRGMKPE